LPDNNQSLSPALFALKESWASSKTANFSLSRLGAFFSSKKKKTNNIDIDKIKTWLKDPYKYQSEIIDYRIPYTLQKVFTKLL